jgi:succinate dehydrogenase/fumarate reductase flavoprotein subunit
MTITYALMEKLEEIEEKKDGRAACMMKTKATELIMKDGACVGVKWEDRTGKKGELFGNVVLATGGFGCDFGPDSLLAKHRKDLLPLPTTNGDHCTGDGIILDANGKRIANELGRRDYVTGRMNANKGPFRLLLNTKASEEIAWHCKHYRSRKIMKFYESGADIAKEMGIDYKVLEQTLAEYNGYAKQMEECGGNGGPYDAYGGGKSFDPFGKKFFVNTPVEPTDCYNVSIITPVIHYTMGGVVINDQAELLDGKGQVIPGLFGSGEINGGIHGENRLGGNSLLDCVVYGRVAGRSAARQLLAAACKSKM